MKKTTFITILCAALCLNHSYAAQDTKDLYVSITKEIIQKIDSLFVSETDKMETEIPGISVAIVNDKSILWSKTIGFTDTTKSNAINPSTIFSIQSMGKTVTTVAILTAVQDGFLDLDTPIKKYLPEFKVNSIYDKFPGEIITIRHLLTHRAGFTHEAPLGSSFTLCKNFEEHIKSISDTWLRYPVGTRFAYSNLGLDLAAYILQVKSGLPFEQYVKQRIFTPLGMKNASLDFVEIEKNKNRVVPFTGKYPLYIPMLGAGAEYMSLNDMVNYIQFFLNNGVVNGKRLLREDLLKEMYKIQYACPNQRAGEGINLEIEPVCDSYLAYKLGRGYGFSSNMIMYPEKNLGIFLITNDQNLDSRTNLSAMAFKIIVEDVLSKYYGKTPVDPSEVESMTLLAYDDERVKGVIGTYGPPWDSRSIFYKDSILGYGIGERFYPLTFYLDNGELVGMLGKYSEIRFLKPYHEGKRPSLMQLHRAVGSRCRHVFEYNYGPNDPFGPNKKEWSKYLGTYCRYKYGELQDTSVFKINISIKNGYLTARDLKCEEYLPGLFFTSDGECVDLRTNNPHFKNIPLKKTK
jgi:CubicO group peptidase (beta-lactamase class C family)